MNRDALAATMELQELIGRTTDGLFPERTRELCAPHLIGPLLDRNADLSTESSEGGTALMVASFWGDEAMVRRLLDNGVSIDDVDAQDRSALKYACSHNANINVIKLLLDAEAVIFDHNDCSESVIEVAASCGHGDIVQMFMDTYLDPADYECERALLLAVECGQSAVVDILLESGVDMYGKGVQKVDLLKYAIKSGSQDVARTLRRHLRELEKKEVQ
jgi:ankyrin repeat protein